MTTPPVKIKKVEVLKQHEFSTEIRVTCDYVGAEYIALTEIREGRDVPDTTLEGYTVPPAEEFVIALHTALDEQTEIPAQEMERICG